MILNVNMYKVNCVFISRFRIKLHELKYFWYISAPPYSIRVTEIYQK